MRRNASPLRWCFTLLLLAGLFFGAAGQSLAREDVNVPRAMVGTPQFNASLLKENSVMESPLQAVDELNIAISEFRFLGPEGGNDEFIELFNPSHAPIVVSGWKIMGSNSSGSTDLRATIGATLGNVALQPGQHYLLVNASADAGLLALKDETYSSGITEDGGIALTLADGTTIIDAVGLSAGSAYQEGATLDPLSGTADQSYERKTAGNAGNCNDTNNNVDDFVWN